MFDIGYNTKDDNLNFTKKQPEEDKYNHIYFLGMLIKIRHGNISNYSFNGKAHLMKLWYQLEETAFRFSNIALFLSFIGTCFNFSNISSAAFGFFVTVLQLLFLTNAKRHKLSGIILYNISLIIYTFTLSNSGNEISSSFIAIACIINSMVFILNIPLLININVIKTLSAQKGFPCFIKSSTELLEDFEEQNKEKNGEVTTVNEEKITRKSWDPFAYLEEKNEK